MFFCAVVKRAAVWAVIFRRWLVVSCVFRSLLVIVSPPSVNYFCPPPDVVFPAFVFFFFSFFHRLAVSGASPVAPSYLQTRRSHLRLQSPPPDLPSSSWHLRENPRVGDPANCLPACLPAAVLVREGGSQGLISLFLCASASPSFVAAPHFLSTRTQGTDTAPGSV